MIISNLKLILTKQFDPTAFIGEGWTIWKGPDDGDGMNGEEDVDPRSLDMTEIEVVRFVFKTCLKADEKSITGEAKLRRLKEDNPDFIRFGGNVFLGLWEDYQVNKENSILEQLHQNFGISFMDFLGLILRYLDGRRYVLWLGRGGDGEWGWGCHWLVYRWDADDSSAGCASQF